MNHISRVCHGPVLSKQKRSIPSAPFPILVNLGLWLTEQELIHNHVVFVYPLVRSIESEVALSLARSHLVSLVCLLTERAQFLKTVFRWRKVSRQRLLCAAMPHGSPSKLPTLFPYLRCALCHSPVYLSIIAARLLFFPGLSFAVISGCWFL